MSGRPEAPAGASPPMWVLRAVVGGVVAALLALAAALAWLAAPAWRLFGAVDATSSVAPSHLYARALVLRRGEVIGRGRVRQELGAAAYREDERAVPGAGAFRLLPGGVLIHLRHFPGPRGPDGGGLLAVRFDGERIVRLERDGAEVGEAALEPVLLATYAGDARADRRPLAPGALPEPLVHAVLAAEDGGFFSHAGISLAAIARAAWADLRAGAVVQGGSTLTQQLVKNLALSDERTLARKLREAVLAALLERRFSKSEILRAYLDTIYLGTHDGVGLIGVGAAARAYFGTDPDELSLAQAATLAGMIAAPALTSPITHPGRARARRNWVLERMVHLGFAAADAANAAAATPVAVTPAPVAPARAPYFAAAARLEARARLGDAPLERAGLALLSTLDWRDEEAAEAAVRDRLAEVERRLPRRVAPLEAALISLDPRDGAVLAYVGGRNWAASQFDRVADARRQAGSAFKPIVYATAFALGVAAPASIVDDEPLAVPAGGVLWQPRDDDGEFRGPLSARAALETSRNLPAVRLALAVGLGPVIATARAMGVASALDPVPSLSLGAAALTPRELATVYATLAAGGVRRPVHLLAAALGPDGRPRPLAALPPPVRALPAPVAFLVTDVLRGVLDRGTAQAARAFGVEDPLAGKTGTTNGGRDAWFAGYAPDRVTVVWVGRDDDAPAGLTGARAALPVWSQFTRTVRPAGGYPPFVAPDGLVRALVDPASGELATTRCPEVVDELFLAGRAPHATCHLHGGWLALPVAQGEGVPTERPGFFHRLLARLFGAHPKKR